MLARARAYSMFAAKAGARLVYGVDACPTICRLANQLIQCNQLQDRIEIINQRLETIEKFEQPIDIIISEWMGQLNRLSLVTCDEHD
jgi:23S rRNA G2069 N7-methylase RlmK/C1962 C5-methylase RlmI